MTLGPWLLDLLTTFNTHMKHKKAPKSKYYYVEFKLKLQPDIAFKLRAVDCAEKRVKEAAARSSV